MKNLRSLGVAVFVLAIAAAGSSFTDIGEWYEQLNKPAFQPTNEIFGPVWTLLYVLLIVAGIIFVRQVKDTKAVSAFLYVFVASGILNLLWSFLFFSQHAILFAFVDILALIATILIMQCMAWKHKRSVTWLLMPYLLWVCFAAVLNLSIYLLN